MVAKYGVVSWNCNGVRSRLADGTLRKFFEKSSEAALVGLVEVKATAAILNGLKEWRDLLVEFGFDSCVAHFSRDVDNLRGLHGVMWLSRAPLCRGMSGADYLTHWRRRQGVYC